MAAEVAGANIPTEVLVLMFELHMTVDMVTKCMERKPDEMTDESATMTVLRTRERIM